MSQYIVSLLWTRVNSRLLEFLGITQFHIRDQPQVNPIFIQLCNFNYLFLISYLFLFIISYLFLISHLKILVAQLLSHVQLFGISWTVACQTSLSSTVSLSGIKLLAYMTDFWNAFQTYFNNQTLFYFIIKFPCMLEKDINSIIARISYYIDIIF